MHDISEALVKAIKIFGNNKCFAAKLDVNPVTVSLWKSGVQKLAYEQVLIIEHLTKGAVTRHELAPDKDKLNKLIEVKY